MLVPTEETIPMNTGRSSRPHSTPSIAISAVPEVRLRRLRRIESVLSPAGTSALDSRMAWSPNAL